MTKLISEVQNFNTTVISGSQAQTVTMKVTIVDHMGDLRKKANNDAVDGAAGGIWPCPDLDSGRRP